MSVVRITCLGVGDGAACGDRNHSSYLYDFDDCSLLVDCGEPVGRSLKALGRSRNDVDQLLVSHLHFDHIGGLFMLLQGFWLERRTKALPVYLPESGVAPITTLLQAGYLFDELLEFELSFHPIETSPIATHDSVQVETFPTSHLHSFRKSYQGKYGGDYHAFGFTFVSGDLRIVHSADLGAPEDLEPVLGGTVDLLICELAHFEPKVLFSYLARKSIRRIAFVHVGREHWAELSSVQALAEELLPGVDLVFPRDGDVIELKG